MAGAAGKVSWDPWPLALLAALAADAILGDPPSWPHMVRLMGAAISAQEGLARARAASPSALRLAGALICLITVPGSFIAAWLLLALCSWLWVPLAAFLAALLAFECISAGQLIKEARLVEASLAAGDLQRARGLLAMIVGRDTAELTPAGVRRAVIETVAENLGDGVVAPLFYLVLLGPAGGVAYKAVNTLDSMLGYKSPRFRDLGRWPARLDDAAGWAPARLCGLLLVAAAWLARLDWRGAWRVLLADHGAHKSPNAGWPEAAAAGALGVALGGPNRYGGELVEKPWLGGGGREPGAEHVAAGLRLARACAGLAGALALAAAAVAALA